MSTLAPRPRGGSTAVLAVLSAAAIMATLDLFIVNVAFPDISKQLGGRSLADVTWVLNGYAVVYAALLVPLGRLADRYGRLRGFTAGLLLFTIASAACADAHSLWTLILFRCLQAAGAAALTPTSLGLLLAATNADERPRAVRTWAASGALAAAAGPVVGGLLVQNSWRWIFVINVPVGIVTLLLALRIVPDSRDPAVTKQPDLVGAGLLALGIGALTLGLVKASTWGWTSASTWTAYAVAATGVVAFVIRSVHHPLPVVELPLLRVRSFAWANVAGLLYSVAFGAQLLSAVLLMQEVWGWSALRAGVAIAPAPAIVPLASALAQRLSRRFAAGVLASAGCVAIAAGTAFIALRAGAEPHYFAEFLPGWLVVGAGAGVAMPTIFSAATAELPGPRMATGSAIVTMGRQIGLTLGVSLLVLTIGTVRSSAPSSDAFRHAWWGMTAVAVLAAVSALRISPRAGTGVISSGRTAVARLFMRTHLGPVANFVTR